MNENENPPFEEDETSTEDQFPAEGYTTHLFEVA